MSEKPCKISDLAARIGLEYTRTREIVMKEPGVIRVRGPKRTTYRIPEEVAARIERRLKSA